VESEVARRTGSVFKVPVGRALLGRVIDVQGRVLDGDHQFTVENMRPIEVGIPGIMERTPVNESLETGILAIDALVPIGKGQRELIIGNRGTGKTSIVREAIVHQKDKNVICVYVAIGQRQANIARLIRHLEERGSLEYSIIVDAQA